MHATPRPSPGALPKCYNKQRAPENHALSSVGGHMQEAHPAVCPPRALHPALWKHKKTEPGNEAGKTKHLSYGLQIAFAVVTQCTTPGGALHPTRTSAYTPHLRPCTPPPSSSSQQQGEQRGGRAGPPAAPLSMPLWAAAACSPSVYTRARAPCVPRCSSTARASRHSAARALPAAAAQRPRARRARTAQARLLQDHEPDVEVHGPRGALLRSARELHGGVVLQRRAGRERVGQRARRQRLQAARLLAARHLRHHLRGTGLSAACRTTYSWPDSTWCRPVCTPCSGACRAGSHRP